MIELVVRQGDTGETITVSADEIINTDAWTCNLQVLSAASTSVISRVVTATNPAKTAFLVQLTAAETSALDITAYRLVIELSNAALTPPYNREDNYVLSVEPEMEVGDLTGLIILTKGENSFDTYTNLLNRLAQMPQLKEAHGVLRNDLKAALVAAYENIGLVNTDFGVYDSTTAEYKTSTSDFTSADIDALTVRQRAVLARSQLVEANCLLGGNPIEDRRRAGLLSDSIGESAMFFRTTKPLELPIYRETALSLRGYIIWTKQIGRG